MESMFRAVFEKIIGGITLLVMLGTVTWWTIDLQKKAAAAKSRGLISMARINHALFEGDRRRRP